MDPAKQPAGAIPEEEVCFRPRNLLKWEGTRHGVGELKKRKRGEKKKEKKKQKEEKSFPNHLPSGSSEVHLL